MLEVGLGGRLDSTNVVSRPALAVITSISLEHTAWLGDTIDKIAREKAGILKAQAPALIGPNVPRHVVDAVAAEVGAGPVEQLLQRFDDYDDENSAIATRALYSMAEKSQELQRLLRSSPSGGLQADLVREGVRALPPCRFHRVRFSPPGPGVYLTRQQEPTPLGSNAIDAVLDVCHNPDAFRRLFEKLNGAGLLRVPSSSPGPAPTRPLYSVVGFSSDKEYLSCLRLLMQHSSRLYLVAGDTPRAAPVSQVLETLESHGLRQEFPHCDVRALTHSPYDTVTQLLSELSAKPASPQPLLLCCGTFFIMSDVRRALQLPHPVDPMPINEQSMKK